MLTSSLLSPSADLQDIAAGSGRRILAFEESESVELIQQALLLLGYTLPTAGADGIFGDETGRVISAYKAESGLQPTDPVAGRGTVTQLDAELTYLDGTMADLSMVPMHTLARDPFVAGVWELGGGDPGVIDRLIDFFNLGDRFCFRLSFLVGGLGAAPIGRLVERPIFEDFCLQRGGQTPDEFLDAAGPTEYVDFLLAKNPTLDEAKIRALGGRRRPDILTHRDPREWYEIKPYSNSGAEAFLRKLNTIPRDYRDCGLPYVAGTAYHPTPEIELLPLLGDAGEQLDVIVHPTRAAPGLILWTLCVRGDFVRYFNRVRITAGVLAIVAALAPEVLEAAEAEAVVEAVKALARLLRVPSLPHLVPRLVPQ